MGQPTVPRSGFWRSFSFAGQGVWHVVRTQRNMRVHLAAALVAVAAGVILHITSADWAGGRSRRGQPGSDAPRRRHRQHISRRFYDCSRDAHR